MLKTGDILDEKYRIRNLLGQGGMSRVYLAENKTADAVWAIKEAAKNGYIDRWAVMQSLITEKEILKGLQQRGIVSVSDVLETKDCFYLVMEYIEGETLEKGIQRSRFGMKTALKYAMQICELLGYLHSREIPILYQDLKPANLMIRKDGSIVLIDFGTARKYQNGEKEKVLCLGTKGYAAPEQYEGKSMGAATDIYAFGMIFLYMLTGLNPAEDEKTAKHDYVFKCQKYHIPEKIIKVIGKCIQTEPYNRYRSCAELFEDLLSCEADTGMQKLLSGIKRQWNRKKKIRKLDYQMRTSGTYCEHADVQYQVYEQWEDILLLLDEPQKDWLINMQRAEIECIKEHRMEIEKDILYTFERKKFL